MTMLGTKLLFLSFVVYVSGQGLSYHGSSNVRMQSGLTPSSPYMPSYAPNVGPVNPVYSPPYVNQPPPSDRTTPQPAYQPAVYQPSPYQRPPQPEPVPVPEAPSYYSRPPATIQPASERVVFLPCTEAPTTTVTPEPIIPYHPKPINFYHPELITSTPVYIEPPRPKQPMQPPIQPPIQPPFQHPIELPIQPPVQHPIEHPIQPPIQHPIEHPIQRPIQHPIEHPIQPPIQPPFQHPIEPFNAPTQPPIQPFECSRGNGYYPIENERDTYIECQNKQSYKRSCPNGLHFNSHAVYPEYPCVYSSKVKCDRSALNRNGQVVPDMTARSEICTKRNGFFKQVGSCDSYIECREFYATNITCPEGLHYNPNITWPNYPCGYPMDVPCLDRGAAQPPRPTADCPHQYGFFPALNSTPGNCGGYRKCVEGRAIDMACPIGLAFNDVTKQCDWPDQVPSCNPEEFLGFECPSAEIAAYGKPLVLNYKYEGDCYYFISCETGRPRLLSCDFGFVFDPDLSKCVDSDLD